MYQYLPVDKVYYGIDVVRHELKPVINQLSANRILVVTTNSLMNTECYRKFINCLPDKMILEIKSKQHTPGNILIEEMGKAKKFRPDIIISFGGGSSIDMAKIISFAIIDDIISEEQLFEYSLNLAKKMIIKSRLPHIAIPTTLSAAEFTCIAGVTNSTNNRKYLFFDPSLTPQIVFLDPVVTEATPDWLWVTSGIRAVDHAVETIYSPKKNPVNDSLALQALNYLYNYLPLSKEERNNLNHRMKCQLGAWMSLFSNINIKMGLSHMIGHQLGSHYNISHGATSAIMLPRVMRFLLPFTYIEQAQITESLGYREDGDTRKEKAEKAPELIHELIERLGVPNRLRDYHIKKDSLDRVVDDILSEIETSENDLIFRSVNLRKDIKDLLENAW